MSGATGIATLMYHEVTDDPASSGFQRPAARRYLHSTAAFARHLEAIARGPLVPELVTRLDPSGPGRHLLLTFDDGGASARYAADELSRRGWPGHFFIVTGRLGERTFLGPSDLRAIRSAGHVIGSHSHTHPDIFRNCSRQQLMEEWRSSKSVLEDLLGEPCVAASVPGGDLSTTVVETAADTGFHYLFTSEPVLAPARLRQCWVLGRLCLKAGCAPRRLEALIRFQGWGRARMARSVKELLRRGLPGLYGFYVRYTTAPRSPVRVRSGSM